MTWIGAQQFATFGKVRILLYTAALDIEFKKLHDRWKAALRREGDEPRYRLSAPHSPQSKQHERGNRTWSFFRHYSKGFSMEEMKKSTGCAYDSQGGVVADYGRFRHCFGFQDVRRPLPEIQRGQASDSGRHPLDQYLGSSNMGAAAGVYIFISIPQIVETH